jgi:hypothetical protein
MPDIGSDNQGLIEEIMRLSEGAIKFYGAMSGEGETDLPESFVQSYVAMNLNQLYGLTITLETGRDLFRRYIDEARLTALDAMDLNNFKLDLVVWDDERPKSL